ncbi:hypothetical protein [Bdellovibrio sp. HCB288]|uniref:hypothetical protein n=1 Tax=Bdellovibrio sp. HCB288 TaxID=3394355 RepID=UPI0039B42451
MKKKTKYFSGEAGVYYSAKWDNLRVLEYEGADIVSVKGKKLKFLGKRYYYWNERFRSRPFKGALTGMEDCLYLGEL